MEKSTFGKRMGTIMQGKGISRAMLNDATGISLQSISNYLNDKRKPDCEWIVKIAEALGVSSDYLLGLSEIPSRNESIQSINEYTGLSQDAIAVLHTEKYLNERDISDFVSFLLIGEELPRLIKAIQQKNELRDNQVGHIDIDGMEHEIAMESLFKKIIEDLFWSVIEDYTIKPGEMLVGYRKGYSNG